MMHDDDDNKTKIVNITVTKTDNQTKIIIETVKNSCKVYIVWAIVWAIVYIVCKYYLFCLLQLVFD